jgi:putative ABC transport system permease protein
LRTHEFPPRLAEWLVRVVAARSNHVDALLGDLNEEFSRLATRSGGAAARWYWRRTFSIVTHYLPLWLRRRRTMSPARTRDSTMSIFLGDLRFGVRALRRAPAFTIAAVLALGLGTGSAAGVFSLLRGVVLRPLPYPQPERLVTLWEVNHTKALEHEPISPVNFVDYRRLNGVFEDAAAWWRPQINLTDESGEPVRVNSVETTENLFAVLGVRPYLGQSFTIHPKLFGPEHETVISYRLWQSRFNGDREIVGKPVRLNGYSYTIVGVMPAGFGFPGQTDLWEQLNWDLSNHTRFAHFMESVVRLKPGVTMEAGQRELDRLSARLGAENKASNGAWTVRVTALDREIAGVFRPALFALLGASGLLLLIACINVANLLLARAVSRRREVALRSAIGASRPRLIRLFLTESFVLAVMGSLIGLGVAVASVRGLLAWSPIRIPRAEDVGVDLTVLLFATLVAAITVIVFGLMPAVFVSRVELHDTLKDGTRGTGSRGSGGGLRNALVVSEVALAVMLLSGSGLLIRSVSKLVRVDAGLDPTAAMTIDLQLPDAAYRDWTRVDQFYTSLANALRPNPEIVGVGAANFLPLEPGWRLAYQVADARTTAEQAPQAQFHIADEGYFSALRIPIISGRTFTAHDDAHAPPVVVINEAMARQLAPGSTALGRRVATSVQFIGPLSRRLVADSEYQVVGVVRDVKNSSLRSASEPAVYFASHQFPSRKMHLVVRGHGEGARLASLVRSEAQRLDPSLPLGDIKAMARVLEESVDPPRFVMLLMSVFAGLALTLAAVGIYGILTFLVSHRRRDIAIRLALGAEPAAMLRMIVREGLGLAFVGCALGVIGSLLAGRALAGFLFGVSPWDPVTLGGVVALVGVVAIAACIVPGRRAASEDPVRALRAE